MVSGPGGASRLKSLVLFPVLGQKSCEEKKKKKGRRREEEEEEGKARPP